MSQDFRMRLGREQAPPALKGVKSPRPDGPHAPPPRGARGSTRRGLKLAQEFYLDGNARAAIDTLEPLRAREPRNAHLLIHLARAYGLEGLTESAEEAYYQAKSASANDPTVDLFLGQTYMQAGRLEEAEEAFRRCLRVDTKNTLAGNLFALCLFRQRRFREAFAEWNRYGWSFNLEYLIDLTMCFETFLLEAPTAPEPTLPPEPVSYGGGSRNDGFFARAHKRMAVRRMLDKAEALLTSQKTVEAFNLTTDALALAPDDKDALLLRAVALYEMDAYQRAGRLLSQTVHRDSSLLPRCFLAYCLLRLGAVETAQEILSKLRPDGPYDYYLHYHLGLCHLIRGDKTEARRYFRIAYTDYFIDSREYCFEYLVQKIRSAVKRLSESSRSTMPVS